MAIFKEEDLLMKIIDKGHIYELTSLDGEQSNRLVFVKRNDPPEKFPGNENAYPGTLMQEVIRALVDRSEYLNNQIPHEETQAVIVDLKLVFYRLEKRAAERHNRVLKGTVDEVFNDNPCLKCGHVQCEDH
jgi:hypothetical protein